MFEKEIYAYLKRNNLRSVDLRAALIDMDGTLYDSMPRHASAWKRLTEEIGIPATYEEFFAFEGRTGASTIGILFNRTYGRDATKEECEQLYHRKTVLFAAMPPVDPMPGAREMTQSLVSHGKECVLVTGSGQSTLINRINDDFPGVFKPHLRITSRDVSRGKPDPEPYLKAMGLVGLSHNNCIVIENAPLGVKAGRAAGVFTIGVNTGPIDRRLLIEAGADLIFDSMEEFAANIETLIAEFESIQCDNNLIFTPSPAAELSAQIKKINPSGIFILVDKNTQRHVLPQLMKDCCEVTDAKIICIEPGDDNKSLSTLTEIWMALEEGKATRKSLLINLGGGMVSDIGGFAAATFKRGIRFINIPTTLLGAVDAAVGGKTGINFAGLKNEIGTFIDADKVIVSTAYFSTLPSEELTSGYAEVLKHALLSGVKETAAALMMEPEDMRSERGLELLQNSVLVKHRIVTEDPHEQGLRKALNLGHTPAHAFESRAFAAQKPMSHGHAVAWGLVVDLLLSHMLLQFPSETLRQVAQFVKEHYPAPDISCDDYPGLVDFMRHDKKNSSADRINFTLLCAPGDIAINQTADVDTITAAFDIFRDLLQ